MTPAAAAMPCYAGGRSFRAMRAALDTTSWKGRDCAGDRAISLAGALDWTAFWKAIEAQLERRDYREGTRQQYRFILRNFYRHARGLPEQVDRATVLGYINKLVAERASWSWLSMNISVLRTAFDKLGGRDLTRALATPKRPRRLPDVLSPAEVRQVLAAAATTRDQVLLGLLYGCGLKAGEASRLTWVQIDPEAGSLSLTALAPHTRRIQIPEELLPVLRTGKANCPAGDYVFQGRRTGTALSARAIELAVRAAWRASGVTRIVTSSSLRHSYAVHLLERGESVRVVQEALGLRSIRSALQYQRCRLPDGATSPLTRIRALQADPSPQPRPALFTKPPSLTALDLPFRPSEPVQTSDRRPPSSVFAAFQRLFKTHIFGRFLCSRRADTGSG